RGIYTLILGLSEKAYVAVGRLGVHRLDPGFYIYVGRGSGKGSSSVEGRLRRHLSKDKKSFWHVDHITLDTRFKAEAVVYAYTGELSECGLARILAGELEAEYAVKGFGSSDCGCRGHLIHASEASLQKLVETIHRIFLKLKLKPEVFRVEAVKDR
ncbi:MAG: GIY-YIG nuclease family protein, partial [Candidatus Bathyarchaeia archaeon]